MGLVASPVDGELDFGVGFVLHRVGGVLGGEVLFDKGAAAEAPGGSADFVHQCLFEDAYRGELVAEGFVEFGVDRLFVRTDEIVEVP